jgi:dTDP-D-glucose 4,6-dehydratase
MMQELPLRHVLIAGGAGFIGSAFARNYFQWHPCARITVVDKLTYAGNLENLAPIADDPRFRFVRADICDYDAVAPLIAEVDAVVNFAAESHVDRSILDPDVFVRTNVLGVNTLLRAAKDAWGDALARGEPRRFVQVSCYDGESRVLTTTGLKRYDEVQAGDEVLTINPETGQIEKKVVERVIVQDYSGPMIAFKSNRIDLLVTPNHRMLYSYRQDPSGRIHIDEASAVATKAACFLPRGKWQGVDREFIQCDGLGECRTEDLFYLVGVYLGDGCQAPQRRRRPNKTGLSRTEFLRQARCADGRFKRIGKVGEQDQTEITCHRIFFDVPQRDRARARLERTLTRLGIHWKAHKGRAAEHIYFSSQAWSRFFAHCGLGAENKRVPRWMLEYSPRHLQALLDGIVDSAGHRLLGKSQRRIATCSFGLVCDLVEIGFKLGLMPRFSELKERETLLPSGQVIKPRRPQYMVDFRDEWIGITKEIASTQQYSGKVWCLKVQDNRNLIVERHGTLTFCGNTDEVYGHVAEGATSEEAPLKPRNPYSASKAGAELLAFSYYTNFGLPVLVTRGANTIGPYQYPEKATPLFITNALEDQPLPVYGEGKAVRHYLYVDDHAAAIDLVLHRGAPGEAYNIGSEDEVNTVELATRILDLLGKPHSLIQFVPDRPGHDYRYSLDSTKLQRLGWRRQYDFERTLEATVAWYVAHPDWWRKIKSGEYREYYQRQYATLARGAGRAG